MKLDHCMSKLIHCNLSNFMSVGNRSSILYDCVQSKAQVIIPMAVSMHAVIWDDLSVGVSLGCWLEHQCMVIM